MEKKSWLNNWFGKKKDRLPVEIQEVKKEVVVESDEKGLTEKERLELKEKIIDMLPLSMRTPEKEEAVEKHIEEFKILKDKQGREINWIKCRYCGSYGRGITLRYAGKGHDRHDEYWDFYYCQRCEVKFINEPASRVESPGKHDMFPTKEVFKKAYPTFVGKGVASA